MAAVAVADLRIRPARSADARRVAEIYVASWNLGFVGLLPARTSDEALVRRWARDLSVPAPHRWWVAASAGCIAGFAGIRPSRDPADGAAGELDTIAVDPQRWRRGIGRALMAVALSALRRDGYRHAIVWTLAHYDRGHAFYTATGWVPDGGTRREGTEARYRHALGHLQDNAPPAP